MLIKIISQKNQQLILDNKALFCPNGTWLPDEMSEAPRAEGFKWGFMALPKVSAEGDSYSSTFSEQVYIPSKAKMLIWLKNLLHLCTVTKLQNYLLKNLDAFYQLQLLHHIYQEKVKIRW